MPKQLNLQQHINGYDMVLSLISQKEKLIAKLDPQLYRKQYVREISELQQLRDILLSFSYIIDYPLVRTMVQAVEAVKHDSNLAGVIVHYPFRPTITREDNFSLIDLCTYGK